MGVLDEPDTPPVLLQFDVPLLQGLLDGISEGVEGQVHVAVIFGGGLHEGHAQGSSQLLCLLGRDTTGALQVTLVANQQEDRLVGALSGHDLLVPVPDVFKGLPVCHIKDQQDTHHIPVKGPGDAPDGGRE